MLMVLLKKTDYATEITIIKNDYVTKAALKNQLNDLKSQHIADEVKKVDYKVKKNITDIATAKIFLLHNKFVLDNLEKEASFNSGFYYYINNLTFFLNQSLNHSLEMEELFMHGCQQEFIMTVIILTCFLFK